MTALRSYYLRVSDIHNLHIMEKGKPGLPVVLFLHGGPGAGVNVDLIEYINTDRYRLIMIDQRGAGKSQPLGELQDNTTQHLLEDIETVRKHLGIDSWIITGGSWGSLLALSYAIAHPNVVSALVLRGLFLGRNQDIEWIYHPNGAARFYPREWQNLLSETAFISSEKLLSDYQIMLDDADESILLEAALKWMGWASISMQDIDEIYAETHPLKHQQFVAKSRLMCHYLKQACFLLDSDYIVQHVNSIAHIPLYILHGRVDVICPLEGAMALQQAHGNATIKILEGVGHSPADSDMRAGLKKVFDEQLWNA